MLDLMHEEQFIHTNLTDLCTKVILHPKWELPYISYMSVCGAVKRYSSYSSYNFWSRIGIFYWNTDECVKSLV